MSTYLEDVCGRDAAIAFALGSDWALDHAEEDLECIAHMPRGTHIGELDISYLDGSLPAQFRTRYDYEFLYLLVDRIRGLRKMAKSNKGIVCNTVLEEIALHVICEYAGVIFELADYEPDTVAEPVETFAAIAGGPRHRHVALLPRQPGCTWRQLLLRLLERAAVLPGAAH